MNVLKTIYEAQIKAEQAQQLELEEALRQARSEIYRLKDIIERTECERDTVVVNAMKRIEQLEGIRVETKKLRMGRLKNDL